MQMEYGVLVGRELGLAESERDLLVGEAAQLGYTSAWTNSGTNLEGVEAWRRWFDRFGLATGVAVVPTPGMDLAPLARAARVLHEASGGRFVLGIGAGRLADPAWRESRGYAGRSPLSVMREHTHQLRQETGAPVYLGTVGPKMLELAGEIADGALPNWFDPGQLAWARQHIAVGARKAGRDPGTIQVAQSIRVAVHDDLETGRVALARAALGYALARPGQPGGGPYRQAMARMGLDEPLKQLEAMRDRGAPDEALAAAFPADALRIIGAWGPAPEARAQFHRLSEGLDTAMVRVVTAAPGLDSARAVLHACAPRTS